MRKLFLLNLLLLYCACLLGQYNVRFIVKQQDSLEDAMYLVGSFNDWNPSDENYKLLPLDAQHVYLDVKVQAGHYEYKFTRGNWPTVEGAASGLDISNREINVRRDTTVNIVIEGWMDKFKDISTLPDSTQWRVAYSRSFFYLETNLDSSYKYAQQANALLVKLHDKKYEADMDRILGRIMLRQGNHQRALNYYLKQLALVQELKDTLSMAFCLLDIGHLYLAIKDYPNAKKYYLQVSKFDPDKSYSFGRSAPYLAIGGIGRVFYNTHQLDSARFYALQAYELSLKAIDRQGQSEALTLLGNILADEGRTGEAINYYLLALRQAQLFNNSTIIAENYQHIARAFYKDRKVDSSLYYAHKAYDLARESKSRLTLLDASNLLVMFFKNNGQTDSALKYLETVAMAKDSLYSQDKNQQLQTIEFNEQLQKQESLAKQEQLMARVKTYIMLGGIVLLLLLSIFLWMNNRRKQRVNILLNQRSEKIQRTLAELEATQSQLIQKEKMASLGQLTAGIAHEIQNPLNFINNFSEVSMEIAKELKDHLSEINVDANQKANLNSVADDLVKNQQKIMEHGQRADSVVKDMLQKSRDTSEEDSLLM
jgi:tetratricopeptide (TPR) repeat protein